MKWGTFGIVHIATIVIAVAIIAAFYFILRKRSRKLQTAVLLCLSFISVGAVIYDLVEWGSPLEYLPLHMCNINALMLPFVVLSRNKTMGNLLLVWALGAVLAIVFNEKCAEYIIFSKAFNVYYFSHICECAVPVLLFTLGHVKMDYKCTLSTLGITAAIYTVVHLINIVLNSYFLEHSITNPSGNIIQVNYMYSLIPEVPIMQLFWSIIPYQYWYMYVVIVIILVYLLLVYSPLIIRDIYKKHSKKKCA